MVSFHKVVEQAKSGDGWVCDFLEINNPLHLPNNTKLKTETEIKKYLWNFVEECAPTTVCFDLGNIESWIGNWQNQEFFIAKTPFPVCWFEIDISDTSDKNKEMKLGILVKESFLKQGSIFRCVLFTKIRSRPSIWGALQQAQFFINKSNNSQVSSVLFYSCDKKKKADWLVFTSTCKLVNLFLRARSCSNVISVQNEPPEKLNKKRIKNGKVPLFSYWTLNLDFGKSVTRGESQGGTHASPRVHLRRGHAREYMPGKFTWVQPCVVGNKEQGVVMKDYKVSGLSGAGGGAG